VTFDFCSKETDLRRFVHWMVLFVLLVSTFVIGACGTSLSGDPMGNDSPESGKVTLHWEAPLHNRDGSLLQDLAGFRIYYGRGIPLTKENASKVDVDKNLNSRSIDALMPGTYFFAVTAIDQSGNESVFSEVVSVDISGV
jgi:hypothetical protein